MHVKHTLNCLVNSDQIPEQFANRCLGKSPQWSHAYGIPKLKDQSVRPVVATYNSPSYKLAKIIGSILKNQLPKQSCVSKNSFEACDHIKKTPFRKDSVWMSLDIKSMYTAIPVNDAIIAFRSFCSKTNTTSFTWNKSILTVDTMVTLIKICLEDNHFTYNGTLYKQIHGLFIVVFCLLGWLPYTWKIQIILFLSYPMFISTLGM